MRVKTGAAHRPFGCFLFWVHKAAGPDAAISRLPRRGGEQVLLVVGWEETEPLGASATC